MKLGSAELVTISVPVEGGSLSVPVPAAVRSAIDAEAGRRGVSSGDVTREVVEAMMHAAVAASRPGGADEGAEAELQRLRREVAALRDAVAEVETAKDA